MPPDLFLNVALSPVPEHEARCIHALDLADTARGRRDGPDGMTGQICLGPNRMTDMPSRQSPTPIQSVTDGFTESTTQSQSNATPM